MAHILRVLPLIGISAFEEKERKLQVRERVSLTCAAKKRGVVATGYVQAGGFVVCKDSLADPEEKGGMHDYMRSIRKELLDKQILVQDGTLYRFTQDYDLSSPSTAAGVVLGRAANGRTEWIDTKSKKTLKALQEQEAGE
ncbi:MAG: DUF4357 domain-containing protein [Akkermansiaceae bacterium]